MPTVSRIPVTSDQTNLNPYFTPHLMTFVKVDCDLNLIFLCVCTYMYFCSKEPSSCPECRRSVVLQQTNRIYFNLSSHIDNIQEYVDQLCTDVAARHNDLYVAKMHLDRQKNEWNIKLREKNEIIDKLNAKIDKLKMKIEKLKGVSTRHLQ